jgi:hypothetical protein
MERSRGGATGVDVCAMYLVFMWCCMFCVLMCCWFGSVLSDVFVWTVVCRWYVCCTF